MTWKLLDLFCGAGGAAMGYYLAGFEVSGVDIEPQFRYPFKFFQGNALDFPLEGYDAYHASPPCQRYSRASKQWRSAGKEYPDLISPIRLKLLKNGRPFIIENVPGSPLIEPIELNGAMFNLNVHRRRWFECCPRIKFVLLPQNKSPVKMGRPIKEGDIIQPVGHFSNVKYAQNAMGINWMTQKELSQAIPPAYTEWIGKRLIEYLEKDTRGK